MVKQIAQTVTLATMLMGSFVAQAFEQSAHVSLTSNYVFRGQTLNNDNMALQGGYDIVDAQDKGWYAGTFASMVDNGAADGLEIDVYGGWKGSFGDKGKFGYDVGVAVYTYTDSAVSDGEKEIYGGINYETAYLTLYLGDDSNAGAGSYNYIDLGAAFVILKDVDLGVHYGHMSRNWADDYNDISATLRKEVNGYDITLGLTYEDAGQRNDSEFFVTVSKPFDL